MIHDLNVGTKPGGFIARDPQHRVARRRIRSLTADLDDRGAAAPGRNPRRRCQHQTGEPCVPHQRVGDLGLQVHGLGVALALAIVNFHRDADEDEKRENDQEPERRRATARRGARHRWHAGGRRGGGCLRPRNSESRHGTPPRGGKGAMEVPRNSAARRLRTATNPMRVVIEGLGEDRALRTLVNGKVTTSLARLRVFATTARVQFASETGAKGGPSAHCSITIDLPRRPELHTDVTAESLRLAFEQAFAMLERQVERDRARGREERRRPKKYYLAKRLLEPGASSEEAPAPPPLGRRLLRRRTA